MALKEFADPDLVTYEARDFDDVLAAARLLTILAWESIQLQVPEGNSQVVYREDQLEHQARKAVLSASGRPITVTYFKGGWIPPIEKSIASCEPTTTH